MKKAFFSGILLGVVALNAQAQNTRRCGNEALMLRIAATNPAFAQARQQRLLAEMRKAPQNAAKGTAQHAIPVVFHILVSQAQYTVLGGDTGIIRRVNSQLAVLNADYSATNTDVVNVPAPFQPLTGNPGLQFRLSSDTSARTIAPGIELKKTNARFDDFSSYADAKRDITGGLNGWNQTQNLNIWVVETSSGTLGVAVPPSLVGSPNTTDTFAIADLGVVVSHTAFGKRTFPAQYFFPAENDLGRTLTHEIGHYFELEHVFGEDYGCAFDDGLTDTPPQYGPTFSSPTSPVFPRFDACSPSGNGIVFMNYMDYVDDAEMMFFTQQQATLMQVQVSPGHPSYSLTQIPQSVAMEFPENHLVSIASNPSAGNFRILNGSSQPLSGIQVLDMTGRVVGKAADVPALESIAVSLPSFAKGFYFLKGNLGNRAFTQKIIIQ